jgi:hypothetical protein
MKSKRPVPKEESKILDDPLEELGQDPEDFVPKPNSKKRVRASANSGQPVLKMGNQPIKQLEKIMMTY